MLTDKDRQKNAENAVKKSLRVAINLMCKECVYDPKASGSAAQQVEECCMPGCPLYPVRPIRRKR